MATSVAAVVGNDVAVVAAASAGERIVTADYFGPYPLEIAPVAPYQISVVVACSLSACADVAVILA
jgi:hypothetical protein